MLGKLLKYEIPALGRKLLPLYAAWAVTAVLLGLMIGPVSGKSEFMTVISVLLYAGVATAVFVMALVMIVQRYNNSLLGDEGYFYHVLPVKAGTHIASKTIAAVVWVLLSGVAMAVTGLLIAVFSGTISELFNIDWGAILTEMFGTPIAGIFVLEFIVAAIFSLAKSVLAIYTALTIGHLASKHVTLACIGAYIGVLTFESVLANILLHIVPYPLLNPETSGEVAVLLLCGIIVSIIIGGCYFFLCRYLMKNKLNLA